MQPVTVPVTVLVYNFFLILRTPSAILLFGCFSLVYQWLGYLQNHLFTHFFWGYATCAPISGQMTYTVYLIQVGGRGADPQGWFYMHRVKCL